MTPSNTGDWQGEIARRLQIAPTISAMQRYLYFARRCSSVEPTTPTPDDHRVLVGVDGHTWTGRGATEAEAMGRTVLAMPEPTEEHRA
jgi:hypothetical protein